jgi:hypothetical protein
MNSLTAVRTFAAPGFTPARHTRIHNDRWYLVTLQNVEHGQGDYIGLADGTYTELLPGDKARECRDAHLNHCNHIAEHHGTVYQLLANRYGGESQPVGWFATLPALEATLDARKAEHDKWIADCLREAGQHDQTAASLAAGTGKSLLTAAHHRQIAEECRAVAARYAEAFRCNVRRIL